MVKRPWTQADIDAVRARYPNEPTKRIADDLGRSERAVYSQAGLMRIKKTAVYLAGPDSGRLSARDTRGGGARFKPGNVSWNKGVKGSTGTHPNCKRAWFKKGELCGAAQHNYTPVGSERVNKDGLLVRKVTDDPSVAPKHRWMPVSRLVWEQAHGQIPRGHAVAFKEGQRTADAAQITLDRLELVSRAELMRRNTIHRYPKEIARLAQLRGVLNRVINNRSKTA